MPIRQVNGGYKWGKSGKVYPNRAGAQRQARAAYASGYKGYQNGGIASIPRYDEGDLVRTLPEGYKYTPPEGPTALDIFNQSMADFDTEMALDRKYVQYQRGGGKLSFEEWYAEKKAQEEESLDISGGAEPIFPWERKRSDPFRRMRNTGLVAEGFQNGGLARLAQAAYAHLL